MPNIDSSLLRRAAAVAAAAQTYAPGTLYMVATPIGNLADITLRALHVLDRVALVACEDTRVTSALLAHFGLHKPLHALHAHNENEAAAAVCSELARGSEVAYVSDAGTPGVSDPGARLVAAAVQAGHRVVPLPGPSSVTTAMSAAGDVHAPGYTFAGFLPSRGAERRAALERALQASGAIVLFESPHRIEALARELAGALAERPLTIARELTKQFEAVVTMTAAELPAWLAADANRRRGEFVVVVHTAAPAAAEQRALPADAERCLRVLLRELPLKQAVALAAEISGAARNDLYEQALRWRTSADPPVDGAQL